MHVCASETVIPTLGTWKQEHQEFQARLGYPTVIVDSILEGFQED